MTSATLTLRGHTVPRFFYGTAWKEERSAELTALALSMGFRGIDTANQRKHYFEAAVGRAVQNAISNGEVTREELFLQTKFTFPESQDHRLPYDARADTATQVAQSFASSLEHFATTYLDSFVLHGPRTARGLTDEDWEAWRAMESIASSGAVRLLGVSNVSLEQLRALVTGASIRPAFVQNRCYARRGWDGHVRRFCADHDIRYQGFSLLTANRRELGSGSLGRLARELGATPAQVVFCFASKLGMIPLTGTSSAEHMRQDLGSLDFELDEAELEAIERISLD